MLETLTSQTELSWSAFFYQTLGIPEKPQAIRDADEAFACRDRRACARSDTFRQFFTLRYGTASLFGMQQDQIDSRCIRNHIGSNEVQLADRGPTFTVHGAPGRDPGAGARRTP